MVVEATLRLRNLSPHLAATVAYFASVDDAARCASAVVSSGLQPLAIELMD